MAGRATLWLGAIAVTGVVLTLALMALIGIPWLALGLFIYVFEIVVAVLQAYIFTLLSAVYIESSIHFEH
jgi:F-type H+-transporting ATPase subunit a